MLRIDDEEAERLLDLPCSSQSANVRHPQHPLSEKDDCFSKSEKKKGNQMKKPRFEAVTIPLTEWNEMKEQNKRILAFLSQNIGESPHDQVGDEMLTQNPETGKKRKAEVFDDTCESDESVEPDYDDQIDLMISCSQTKKYQTCRKTDLEQPSEMTDIEQDFDVAEKLGPVAAETIAKLFDGTMAKGQMSDDKFKEKNGQIR